MHLGTIRGSRSGRRGQNRHALAGKVDMLQFVPMAFPVFLQLAIIPGGNAENQQVVVSHQTEGLIGDIVKADAVAVLAINLGADFLSGHFCVAGRAAVK